MKLDTGVYVFSKILIFFFNKADILKICKLDGTDAICQLTNIGFWIQHALIPLIVIPNPFLHKMSVLLKLSDFSNILSPLKCENKGADLITAFVFATQ